MIERVIGMSVLLAFLAAGLIFSGILLESGTSPMRGLIVPVAIVYLAALAVAAWAMGKRE